MNTSFLTFASTNIKPTTRLVQQITDLHIFDRIIGLNEFNLNKAFFNILMDRINTYGLRGFGYWSWKPFIILNELNNLQDNDILVYSDAGSTPTTRNLFINCFNKLQTYPIIGFKTSSSDYSYTTNELIQAVQTKLNYNFTPTELKMKQIAATTLFIRKTNQTVNLIKIWNDICQDTFDVITDKYNVTNKKHNIKFIDNRHDQSVLSLLSKYNNKLIYVSDNIIIKNPFIHTRIK